MKKIKGGGALEFLVLLPKTIDVALSTKKLYMLVGKKRFSVDYVIVDSNSNGKIYAPLYVRRV